MIRFNKLGDARLRGVQIVASFSATSDANRWAIFAGGSAFVSFDGHAERLRSSVQDIDRAIFSIATKPHDNRDRDIEFQERFSEPVGGPELLLACNAGTRAEVSAQIGLGQNDPRCACTLAADGLPEVSVKFAIVNPSFVIASMDIMDPPPPAP